ncbi:unnamed protein product [Cylindrotheca closterium]|uniref:G-protein coupled receptors family 1 profile domain-containing protein n=1 Tax=Cylindrotheca closterium TaxID=2856 RepID=A0AAD2CKV1_9STRA|nr:unnamed protein product [Cylindrotheca closterium]
MSDQAIFDFTNATNNNNNNATTEDAFAYYYDDNKLVPRLRVHELTDDSSRYDRMAAAPPDEQLVYYWYTWAGITLICGIFSITLFASILIQKNLRGKPFNMYLLYLMVPDFVFCLLCSITCFLNATKGSYWSVPMCHLQQWYSVFGIGGSAWINAIIAYQIHEMLKNSNVRRRYRVPTKKSVTLQCLAAFAWVIFLGSWGIYDTEHFPFHSGQMAGLACLPLEVDQASTLFFWLVFFPLFAGIPTGYGLWVGWHVYRNNLLPPMGKRRLLSVYFGRLLLVYCVMWIPAILFIFIIPGSLKVPAWTAFAGGTWSHLQTFVSCCAIVMKPDINEAYKDFMLCRIGRKKREEEEEQKKKANRRTDSTGSTETHRNSNNPYGRVERRYSCYGEDHTVERGSVGSVDDPSRRHSHSERTDMDEFPYVPRNTHSNNPLSPRSPKVTMAPEMAIGQQQQQQEQHPKHIAMPEYVEEELSISKNASPGESTDDDNAVIGVALPGAMTINMAGEIERVPPTTNSEHEQEQAPTSDSSPIVPAGSCDDDDNDKDGELLSSTDNDDSKSLSEGTV